MSFMDAMSNVMGDAAPMLGKKKKNFSMPGDESMPAGKPKSKGKGKPMPKSKAKAKPMPKGKKPCSPKNSK